jgi:glycosyltransferase involved in cell wall biosynthesis
LPAAQPHYSIVVPAYNESARIADCLENVLATVQSEGWDAEILVVNDGSKDDTALIIGDYAKRYPSVRLVDYAENRGKGYAVRTGFRESRGKVVMFTDADLSSPMVEARRLFAAIADGADIAIGSRWLEVSRQTIRQPWYRRFFGRCFNLVTRAVMNLPYKDTQCGFKAFTRDAAIYITPRLKIDRWGFDPEMLFLAGLANFKVREVPVTWAHDARSKISYLKDGLKMLEDMARIRWYSLTGAYRRYKPTIPSTPAA